MGTQAETERKVYTVSAFNRRLAGYVGRVRDVWVEGEVAELRSNPAWATVFLTLKDGRTGACLSATMQRRRFELIEPAVAEGERVQANGALQLYEARGELSFRVTALERVGAGDHAARLAELRRKLAAEGLFAAERKRRLPRFPRAVGLLTGADAAARGDVIAAVTTRYPAVRLVVLKVAGQGGHGSQRVHGDVEEALQLLGVDIHIDHSRGAQHFQGASYDFGADGFPAVGHAVLAGIGEVGDQHIDPPGRGTAKSIQQQHQFHQVVVYRPGTRLDQKDILVAHQLFNLHMDLAVGQVCHAQCGEGDA